MGNMAAVLDIVTRNAGLNLRLQYDIVYNGNPAA